MVTYRSSYCCLECPSLSSIKLLSCLFVPEDNKLDTCLQFEISRFETWHFRLIGRQFIYGIFSYSCNRVTVVDFTNATCSCTVDVMATVCHQGANRAPHSSWLKNAFWICCVKCRAFLTSQACPYFISKCGHIYCSRCREIGKLICGIVL